MDSKATKKQCSDPKVILKSDMEVTTSTIPISSLTQVPSHHPTVFVSCKVSEYLRSSDITPGSQSTKRTREHIAIWTTFVHTYLHAYIIIYYIIIYVYVSCKCLNSYTSIYVCMVICFRSAFFCSFCMLLRTGAAAGAVVGTRVSGPSAVIRVSPEEWCVFT